MSKRDNLLQIDVHGFYPDDLGCRFELESGGILERAIREAWEAGHSELRIIHGHGHNRNLKVSANTNTRNLKVSANTNTGFMGLCIRRSLQDERVRQFVKISTLDRSDPGTTSIKLKPNRQPTRSEIDWSMFQKEEK